MKKLTRKGHVDTLPVFGTTVKSVIKTPLLEAMGIKSEVRMKYCPVVQKKLPINLFYAQTPVEDATDVRRVCREAWDCKIIDPDTHKEGRAAGVRRYDSLVREKLLNPMKDL